MNATVIVAVAMRAVLTPRNKLAAASSKKYLSARTRPRFRALVGIHELAMVQRDHPPADAPDQIAIVRRDEHRGAARVHFSEQVHDVERKVRVEIARRLVSQDE